MAARPVQISLEQELLERIDRDPQTKKQGRSAFIREAILLYLEAKRRKRIDAQIASAFREDKHELLNEIESFLRGQAWPKQ